MSSLRYSNGTCVRWHALRWLANQCYVAQQYGFGEVRYLPTCYFARLANFFACFSFVVSLGLLDFPFRFCSLFAMN
jgi:hypothetical protein